MKVSPGRIGASHIVCDLWSINTHVILHDLLRDLWMQWTHKKDIMSVCLSVRNSVFSSKRLNVRSSYEVVHTTPAARAYGYLLEMQVWNLRPQEHPIEMQDFYVLGWEFHQWAESVLSINWRFRQPGARESGLPSRDRSRSIARHQPISI